MNDEPSIRVKPVRYGFALVNERDEFMEMNKIRNRFQITTYTTRKEAQARADKLNTLR